jgi:hypothetical protein
MIIYHESAGDSKTGAYNRASAYKIKVKGGILGVGFSGGSYERRTITANDAFDDLFLGHSGPPDRAKQALSLA